MRKWIGLLGLSALLLLCACAGASSSVPESMVPSSIPAPPVSSAEMQPTPEEPITKAMLFDQAEIQAQFDQVVAACSDVIDGFVIDIEKAAYPLPTPEEYARMSEAIGALGFSADTYNLNMTNYDQVESFWREVQQGKDAQTVIYCLYNWGITADILIHKDQKSYYTMAVYDYPQTTADGTSSVRFNEPLYKMENLQMTEKGYLVGFIPEQDGYSEMYRGYRVAPMNEEYRALCKKYVWGIGYMADNLLRYDWSKDDLSKLNLNWVFDSLYYKRNGEFSTTKYTALDEMNRTLIPADVMEDIMLGGLPITKEQLRESILFDEAKQEYAYQAFAGGGFSPTPEVVAVARNADGTISLTVDAVAIEFGDDQSMRSILTVMDLPDGGFRYLSNVVVIPIKQA